MFRIRPDLAQPGFNLDGSEDVPGFQLADDGSAWPRGSTLDGGSSSFTPVRWSPGQDGNGESQLSFWDDVLNAAKRVGEGANAAVEGAYSLVPGTGNFVRGAGRGLGFYGPEEAQRFRQEMNVAGQGLQQIVQEPVQSARLAWQGARAAVREQPMLPFYVAGRAGMGLGLALNKIPIAPFAIMGDALHALEKGHNLLDTIGYGISGSRAGER